MGVSYVGKPCPYCRFPLKPDARVVACAKCGLPIHLECWTENGSCCASFGCGATDYVGLNGPGDAAPTPALPVEATPVPSGRRPRWATLGIIVASLVLGCAVGTMLLNARAHPRRNSPSAARSPALADRIVYVAACSGQMDIFMMDPDGGNVARLTRDDADDFDPAVSPDGRKIVFVSERDGSEEIYVMNADGSDVTRLTDGSVSDSSPAFAQGGSTVVFLEDRGEDSGLYTDALLAISPDGSNGRTIARSVTGGFVVSPDGNTVLYVTGSKEHCSIRTSALDASSTRIVIEGSEITDAVYSPNGKTVVYMSSVGDGWALWTVDVAGGTPQRVCDLHHIPPRPLILSPDGSTLLYFECGAPTTVSLVDGKQHDIVASDSPDLGAFAHGLCYSPDGARLLIAADNGIFATDSALGKYKYLAAGGWLISWARIPESALPKASTDKMPGTGYHVSHKVKADFDGDGEDETAFTASSPEPPAVDLPRPTPKLVCIAKHGQTVWTYVDEGVNASMKVAARDINGDGRADLLFTDTSCHGNSVGGTFHAFTWDGSAYSSMIGIKDERLAWEGAGGVAILARGQTEPAVLVYYGSMEDGACRADPAHYRVQVYRWNGHLFTLNEEGHTARRYGYGDHPLAEFGISEDKQF